MLGWLVPQEKPASTVHKLEHPSPCSVFPSSHYLAVPDGIRPLPQIIVQGAVLLVAVYSEGHTHADPDKTLSPEFVVVEQEVQLLPVPEHVRQGDAHITEETVQIATPLS